jgi:chromosome transmission fidelity protein 1
VFSYLLIAPQDSDDPDWIIEHMRTEKRQTALQERQDLENRLTKVREKEKKIKERQGVREPLVKRRKITSGDQAYLNVNENHFLLDDYESDDESRVSRKVLTTDHGLSADTEALMKRLGLPIGGPIPEPDAEMIDEMKIFYCSRTHSQLSQFSNELRRVQLPPTIDSSPLDAQHMMRSIEVDVAEGIKHLTLGARKNLCINPKVNKLASATAINERCLDLQQPGIAAESKCAFLPTKETEALANDFRDHALASIRDIEDLGAVGRQLGICPYYASRPAVKPCEVLHRKHFSEIVPCADYTSDYNLAIPASTTESCPRSAQPFAQRSHNYHRRSSQPDGCHNRNIFDFRLSVPASAR